jgi:hypothetical protein
MNQLKIKIKNWERYNPRNDRKNHTWFRVEKTIAVSQDLFGLSASQRWLWICLMAEACKAHGETFFIDIEWLANYSGVSYDDTKQAFIILLAREVIELLEQENTPIGDDWLPLATKIHRLTPLDTSRLTTNERTNERTVSNYEPLPPEQVRSDAGSDGVLLVGSKRINIQSGAIPELIGDEESNLLLNQVSQKVQRSWLKLYDVEFIEKQLIHMNIWLMNNSAKKPRSQTGYSKFCTGWLSRSFDSFRKFTPSARGSNEISKVTI